MKEKPEKQIRIVGDQGDMATTCNGTSWTGSQPRQKDITGTPHELKRFCTKILMLVEAR